MADHTIKQPNSHTCFVCGRDNPVGLHMEFFDNGVDEVVSHYTVPEQYAGYPGIVHGGILSSMLDETVARVSMIGGEHHHFMMSVKLEVKFRHSVPVNTPITVKGTIIKLRGRLGKAKGEIILPDGTVACDAEMTLADLPKEILESADMESLGWWVDE
ncbi:MAG: PaaI family thioesterase [Chloroflexota bacterium]